MAAVSKGRIHDVFTTVITDLAAQATAQAAALRGTGLSDWNRPTGVTDPLDVPGTTAGFDRAAINTNYGQVIGSAAAGTIGDVVALKVQVDYVAVVERAFRARHCTPVRLLGFAAARRRGHGNGAGVLVAGVLGFAQDALKAGQS